MPLNRYPDGGKDKYLPGSFRKQVITPQGDIISRAASENNFAADRGFRSNYEYKKFTRGFRGNKNFRKQLDKAKRRGVDPIEFRAMTAAQRKERMDGLSKEFRHRGGGPLAQFMYATGYIDSPDVDVPMYVGS